jgi:hypothetical protein
LELIFALSECLNGFFIFFSKHNFEHQTLLQSARNPNSFARITAERSNQDFIEGQEQIRQQVGSNT